MPVDYWVEEPKNNFEKIKQNLTVDSLAELIANSERVLDKACTQKFCPYSTERGCTHKGGYEGCKEAVKEYLESRDIEE